MQIDHQIQIDEHEGHPGPREYAVIATILTVITAFEVTVYYIEALPHTALAWILVILMISKFVLVVGWYMHLRFDHRYFRYLFVGGLTIATSIVIALAALFDVFT